MNSTQVAVDLAKSVFEVAVSRRPGKVGESHRLSRSRFQKFFAVREPVEVLMEGLRDGTSLGPDARGDGPPGAIAASQ